MEKVNTIVTNFVAFDGKSFNTEEECRMHEIAIQERKEIERIEKETMNKMNIVDMRENKYLFEHYVSGFDYHYIAYKFVYNSDFSFEQYLIFFGYNFKCGNSFETIINGEIKDKIPLKDMPSLEAGETYLIICFIDFYGDYTNPAYWYLYKLKDFKELKIKEINEL